VGEPPDADGTAAGQRAAAPVTNSTWSSWFVDAFLHTPWPAASEQTQAELGAAAREFVDAVDEHQTFVREATSAQTQADRIRPHANSLTNEADLPSPAKRHRSC